MVARMNTHQIATAALTALLFLGGCTAETPQAGSKPATGTPPAAAKAPRLTLTYFNIAG
jgi:hypothetical protein